MQTPKPEDVDFHGGLNGHARAGQSSRPVLVSVPSFIIVRPLRLDSCGTACAAQAC